MPMMKALTKPSTRKRARLTFQVIFLVEPDGTEYLAYCPELPGVLMPGATPQEALENARVAARLCLETMIEYGDPIPLSRKRATPRSSKIAQAYTEEIVIDL